MKVKRIIDVTDDVAVKIAITEACISLMLNSDEQFTYNLKKELDNLETLKQKHPEYFI